MSSIWGIKTVRGKQCRWYMGLAKIGTVVDNWSLVNRAMPAGLCLLDTRSFPAPYRCDNQKCLQTFPNVPSGDGAGGGAAESLWARNHGFRASWSLSNCFRRQRGNSVRLHVSDNVKKSRGESPSIKWYFKSENVGWIHFNKDPDSLWGLLLATGSFKYINISHSTSNKGSQIWIPETRLLMVFAFVIHFSIQPDSRKVCEPSGKKNTSSSLPIWHASVGWTGLAFLWGVWQPEYLISFFYFVFWVRTPRGLWTIASFLIKLIYAHRKFTYI